MIYKTLWSFSFCNHSGFATINFRWFNPEFMMYRCSCAQQGEVSGSSTGSFPKCQQHPGLGHDQVIQWETQYRPPTRGAKIQFLEPSVLSPSICNSKNLESGTGAWSQTQVLQDLTGRLLNHDNLFPYPISNPNQTLILYLQNISWILALLLPLLLLLISSIISSLNYCKSNIASYTPSTWQNYLVKL